MVVGCDVEGCHKALTGASNDQTLGACMPAMRMCMCGAAWRSPHGALEATPARQSLASNLARARGTPRNEDDFGPPPVSVPSSTSTLQVPMTSPQAIGTTEGKG